MKWSQLKKRIEATFADSVRGRVEVWNTRYRSAHDQEGEAWITFDGELVAKAATGRYYLKLLREAWRLRRERQCADFRDPEQALGYSEAHTEAERTVRQRGVFPAWEFSHALFLYLSMAIDEIISSNNPVIRAFGVLDKRFGVRRLRAFDARDEHPLVKTLFEFRRRLENEKRELARTEAAQQGKDAPMKQDRLARQCRKPDPASEKALAEEKLSGDVSD